ncbi:TolC family protein [Silvibacterium acidisoli]|uniref:TolC family protein n=1 Tax=Acidobacteriaceae bacterium ZG23-2 TaxID=2883246 RepID=UPI00406CA434
MKILTSTLALIAFSTPGYTQCMAGMQMPGCPATVTAPKPAAPAQPISTVQEPENPGQQTGSNLPVPELLAEVNKRSPMQLAEFVTMADTNNPTLKQAAAEVSRAQAQAKQAALYPNPSVGYQGDQIRGGSYGGGEQGGYVEQQIILGGKLGLRRNISLAEQKSGEIGVEEQRIRVHADVEEAFYTALAAQRTVDTRRQLMGVALEAVATVHQLANVGQADAPDILQTEVEAEQAKVDYESAQRGYLAAFQALAIVAGRNDLPAAPLKGDLEALPQLDAEATAGNVAGDSPSIQRAQQQIAIADARLRDAKREAMPDLTLRAGEQYNGEQLGSFPPKATGAQSFASANIDLPLWNRNQGNIESAKVEKESAQLDVTRQTLMLQRRANELAQNYLSAKFAAERYRTQLIPRAERAHQLYLEKYQAMAQAYPQVLVSQRTLFDLQIGYIDRLREAWGAAIALENKTLSGALTHP